MEKKYNIFKSGSDIRGFGLGDESNPLYLSNDIVRSFSFGFAHWLSEHCGKRFDEMTISIGHDSRLSADRVREGAISALTSLGIDVKDCGLSSTPAMFMTTIELGCDGAIQITASHHPKDRNGLKFFTAQGGLDGEDIEKILVFAQNPLIECSDKKRKSEKVNFMDTYADNLKRMICEGVNSQNNNEPLKDYKIVVDAGNGVGGFYAKKVLLPLGADISASQFLEPDGNFPNHLPNPEDEVAMRSVSTAVKRSNADFGIIFDTDVDRAGCVGEGGFEINRNRLVALAASIALENNSGATIVTDSVTSDGLTDFIEKSGGKHLRFKRGYRNVINKQIELNKKGINTPLAIETSGHAAFKENYYLDDGAYLITKIIIKMAKLGKEGSSIENIIDSLNEPLETLELRFNILEKGFKEYGEKIIGNLTKHVNTKSGWSVVADNYEGIRINCDKENGNGWFLLRISVHDPVMPINLESNEVGGVKKMINEICSFLKKYEMLDISSLEKI